MLVAGSAQAEWEQLDDAQAKSVRGGNIGFLGTCDVPRNCYVGCEFVKATNTYRQYNPQGYVHCLWLTGIYCANSHQITCEGWHYLSLSDCLADEDRQHGENSVRFKCN